jgi:hypothetical protein
MPAVKRILRRVDARSNEFLAPLQNHPRRHQCDAERVTTQGEQSKRQRGLQMIDDPHGDRMNGKEFECDDDADGVIDWTDFLGSMQARREEAQANLQAAIVWRERGYNVVPQKAINLKRPSVTWKPYQDRRVTRAEIRRWDFANGVGFITGPVSGAIVIESDGSAIQEHRAQYERLIEVFRAYLSAAIASSDSPLVSIKSSVRAPIMPFRPA